MNEKANNYSTLDCYDPQTSNVCNTNNTHFTKFTSKTLALFKFVSQRQTYCKCNFSAEGALPLQILVTQVLNILV